MSDGGERECEVWARVRARKLHCTHCAACNLQSPALHRGSGRRALHRHRGSSPFPCLGQVWWEFVPSEHTSLSHRQEEGLPSATEPLGLFAASLAPRGSAASQQHPPLISAAPSCPASGPSCATPRQTTKRPPTRASAPAPGFGPPSLASSMRTIDGPCSARVLSHGQPALQRSHHALLCGHCHCHFGPGPPAISTT